LCTRKESAVSLQIRVEREWSTRRTGKERSPEVKRSRVRPKADARKSNNDGKEKVYLHEANLSLLTTGRHTFGSKIGGSPHSCAMSLIIAILPACSRKKKSPFLSVE